MATWINDLKNNLVAADGANSIKPQTSAVDVTGAAVDLRDADGMCFAALHVGAIAGTPTLDVKLQESETSGGTFTDIPGAAFAQITDADHYRVLNFRRTKGFVRAFAAIAGTTPSFDFAVAVLSQKKSVA